MGKKRQDKTFFTDFLQPYPDGWNLPGGGAQRGNVLNLNGAGDPLTPGYPAKGALEYIKYLPKVMIYLEIFYVLSQPKRKSQEMFLKNNLKVCSSLCSGPSLLHFDNSVFRVLSNVTFPPHKLFCF